MEAAHIVDEHKGGSNESDNGIPVCFDCHQEIGGYDDKHPKGNKFRPRELKARREHIYQLVESGALYAQLMAQNARAVFVGSADIPDVPDLGSASKPSREATKFVERLLASSDPPAVIDKKLALFGKDTQAQIIDQLQSNVLQSERAIAVLAAIARGKVVSPEQAALIVERVVREVTLSGDVGEKVAVLREFDNDELSAVLYESIRAAFFEDVLAIVKRDQFEEVNKLVPALVERVGAIPPLLYSDFANTMFAQARSTSWQGAPAAKRAIRDLPEKIAAAAIDTLDARSLLLHYGDAYMKSFVKHHMHLAKGQVRTLLDDYLSLSSRDFLDKHGRDLRLSDDDIDNL